MSDEIRTCKTFRPFLEDWRNGGRNNPERCGNCGQAAVEHTPENSATDAERIATLRSERDTARAEVERRRELADQFESYGYPNVKAVLDVAAQRDTALAELAEAKQALADLRQSVEAAEAEHAEQDKHCARADREIEQYRAELAEVRRERDEAWKERERDEMFTKEEVREAMSAYLSDWREVLGWGADGVLKRIRAARKP